MIRALFTLCCFLAVPVVACAPPIADATADTDPVAEPSIAASTTPSGLYYEVSGSGDPVVLVHAFSLDRRMWTEQVRLLEGRFRVVRFDQRGHGRSGEPLEPYAAHTDLLEVVDTLGLESAALVGLSSGAEAIVDFALAHPERVERMLLASPGLSGYVPQGSFEWMSSVIAAIQAGEPEEAMRHWVRTPLMALADPGADARMREIGNSNWRLWTYSPELRAKLDPPAVERLREIVAPTLVVVGDLDQPDTLRVGKLIETGVEGSEMVELAGAGHLVNLAAPEAFNRLLLEFLGGGDG